jgi:hypothetical protein
LVQAPRKTLFDNFHDYRGIAHFRFGDEQVKVFGHEDISVHDKTVLATRFFQDFQEKVAAFGGAQFGLASVAAAGNEMQIFSA